MPRCFKSVIKARVGINVVVSCATGMLDAGDVHDIAAFFHERGIETKFNMCVITGPSFLQARHVPDELKEKYLSRIEAPRIESISPTSSA